MEILNSRKWLLKIHSFYTSDIGPYMRHNTNYFTPIIENQWSATKNEILLMILEMECHKSTFLSIFKYVKDSCLQLYHPHWLTGSHVICSVAPVSCLSIVPHVPACSGTYRKTVKVAPYKHRYLE